MHFIQQTKAFLLVECVTWAFFSFPSSSSLWIAIAWSLRLNYDALLRFAYLTVPTILNSMQQKFLSYPWRDYLYKLAAQPTHHTEHWSLYTRPFRYIHTPRSDGRDSAFIHFFTHIIFSLEYSIFICCCCFWIYYRMPTWALKRFKMENQRWWNSTRALKIKCIQWQTENKM